ncbi:MAG: COX15/CtaA family protein [Terriglobales bacterium]
MRPVIASRASPAARPADTTAAAAGRLPAQRWFVVCAWITLGYTLLVILWGAYVRAAGAGNGCGASWPLCDGQFLPAHPQLKMLIEFLHRASSGVDGVLIGGLALGAWWRFPRQHAVRRAAAAAAVFLVLEALLGAALVLFGWVGQNGSAARVAADGLHLANTLLLLACVALTAGLASGLPAPIGGAQRTRRLLGAGLLGVLATGVCGVMAALADTLHPVHDLAAGLRADVAASGTMLERLRLIHPAIAVAVGLYLLYLVHDGLPRPSTVLARRLGWGLAGAVLLQWSSGLLDVSLLAPVWLQLVHLFTADLLWLTLVFFAAASCGSVAACPD